MSEVTVNKEHKDRLFNYIFGSEENREWTLSLYNAVNGSHYTDASLIEFNTLKEVLYLSMRNDTSFIISGILYLYEHQSSFNPNMPLRVMGYLDKLYSGYIKQNGFNRFGKTLIPLPVPKFVVFYNGEDEKEDETILYLSDSFDEEKRAEADIEIKVRMLNVNYGRNREILKACKPLEEYAWCINKIREKNREFNDINLAVDWVLKNLPADYVIRPFLLKHQSEVKGMIDIGGSHPDRTADGFQDGECFRRHARTHRHTGRKQIRRDRHSPDSTGSSHGQAGHIYSFSVHFALGDHPPDDIADLSQVFPAPAETGDIH